MHTPSIGSKWCLALGLSLARLGGVASGLAGAQAHAQEAPAAGAAVEPAAPAVLDWSALRPADQAENNPFAKLSDAQLSALGEIVFIHRHASAGNTLNDTASARIADLVARLAAQGLDATALLVQRDALMAQRRRLAETPDSSLDGREVLMHGYLVPAAAEGQGVADYLFVPYPNACSHAPLPAVNQIVRLAVDPALAGQVRSDLPVRVSGRLKVQPREQRLWVADGALLVRSAYTLQAATVSLRQGPRAFEPVTDASAPKTFAPPLHLPR